VDKVEDVVKEGDIIEVKVIGYDNQGRLKLSKKDVSPPPEGYNGANNTNNNERPRENRRPNRPMQRRPNNKS